jgi:hypothetical protein
MRQLGLTVGHRDVRNPRCGFELINAAAVGGLLTVTRRPHCVIAGLDPAIHPLRKTLLED